MGQEPEGNLQGDLGQAMTCTMTILRDDSVRDVCHTFLVLERLQRDAAWKPHITAERAIE